MKQRYNVVCGKVEEELPIIPDGYFDACFCDPPYGLSFMGKLWDHGVPAKEVWMEVLRVLKPGSFLLAFGGTRTFHRLACAIEDAGFEIRDCLSWLYGSGFPKSLDISKAIDKAAGVEREDKFEGSFDRRNGPTGNRKCEKCGKWLVSGSPCRCPRPQDIAQDAEAIRWQGYGTALKPAWEPIVVAMKPLDGTFVANALEYGVAGINVDASRIGDNPGYKYRADANGTTFHGKQGDRIKQSAAKKGAEFIESQKGRWPANVMLDDEAAVLLGEPSRFFYCAKASRSEREAGLREAGLREAECRTGLGGEMPTDDKGADRDRFSKRARNHHPTVKPLALNEYLAKLILPPERATKRRLIVPFSGSGSEMIGAMKAGWDEVWGIESEDSYCELAEARLSHWTKERV